MILIKILLTKVSQTSRFHGGNFEDACLWVDKRGHFHVIFHVYKYGEPRDTCEDSTISAHIFSGDGYEWHLSEEQPYDNHILMSDNQTLIVSTRSVVTLETRVNPANQESSVSVIDKI